MRKLVLLPFLFVVTNAFAYELHSFDQVKSAVTTGKSIRIAIDFSNCSAAKRQTLKPKYTMGIFTPNEIIVDNDGRIAASLMHFTLNNPSFPAKPIYEFVRYTITANDSVNLTSQILDATNYMTMTDKLSFDCKIDAGAKIYA